MTTHELKIKSEYFMDIAKGAKKAEIRYNDRNRTGNQCTVIVSHILDDAEYLRDGYVMLSIGVMSRFVLNEVSNNEQ